ncbi:MAG: GLPGLI family protein [Bacteroidota bacterium]
MPVKNTTGVHLFFFFLSFIFISNSTAQNQDYERSYATICQYEMEYQPDSTNPLKKKALMGLLLNQDNSLFGAWKNLLIDTVMYNYFKKAPANATPPKGSRSGYNYEIEYRVYKNVENKIGTIDWVKAIGSPVYEYEEPKTIFSWKILPDTATITGYVCQKATCDFGNRRWVAWFTSQVPISDGPYKFCGLPGLIIQVKDASNSWSFTLTSLENKEFTYSFYNHYFVKNIIKTTKDNFLATLKHSYDNGFEMAQQNGIDFLNRKEEEKKNYEERARRENNWIEIYRRGKIN